MDSDSDDDGMNDGNEVYAGTNPNDPDSVLHIIIPTPAENSEGELILQWPSISNKHYTILRALALNEAFATIQTNVPATPAVNTYLDTDWTNHVTFYYKIKCE